MTMIPRRAAAKALLAAPFIAAGLESRAALAQEFPTRPLRIIVPFPPGQANDIFARLVADKASEGRFRANRVITENRGGAGGTIGMQAVARAAPDGYTLGFGSLATLAINPSIMKAVPYDVERDFAPVIRVFEGPLLLVVSKNSNADAKGLVERLKKGGLTYGSSGPGSTQHMTSELLLQEIGGSATHVPYRGSGPAMTDLMAGALAFAFESMATAVPLVQSGQMRALAVTSAKRVPQLPDVPTVAEAVGLPGFVANGSGGILAPAGTPSPIVQALYEGFAEAMRDPSVRARFSDQATVPLAEGPEEFSTFIRAELAKWREVARKGSIVLE